MIATMKMYSHCNLHQHERRRLLVPSALIAQNDGVTVNSLLFNFPGTSISTEGFAYL